MITGYPLPVHYKILHFRLPVLFAAAFSLLVLAGCDTTREKTAQPPATVSAVQTTPPVLVLQPLGDISPTLVQEVNTQLRAYYPYTRIAPAIPLPQMAWYAPRSRYRADSLIAFLAARTISTEISIGLTTKDISTTKGAITDWGVMGLGYQPGRACVASTYRLLKADVARQLFRVAIHEAGHNFGLPHCAEKTCFMRDAEGGNPTHEETGFCGNCAGVLQQLGWKAN